jgi:hypothetical protein
MERKVPPPPDVSAFYGARVVAARYCSLTEIPGHQRGHWQHGWNPEHLIFDPDIVVGINSEHIKDDWYWVSRGCEAEYLAANGYRSVRAIGLPLVYLADAVLARQPGSLLVMPAHSIPDSEHDWDFNQYAAEISGLRDLFSLVTVCIHPTCWEKGYWVGAFQARGFSPIRGIAANEPDGYYRLRDLMSSHEYMTTNHLGSHVPYAAYFGAKVSVWGRYAQFRERDYARVSFYQNRPSLLRPALDGWSEASMRTHYPQFFCHPSVARDAVDWGRQEVGFSFKREPSELLEIFRWRRRDRAIWAVRSAIPEPVKQVARSARALVTRNAGA